MKNTVLCSCEVDDLKRHFLFYKGAGWYAFFPLNFPKFSENDIYQNSYTCIQFMK